MATRKLMKKYGLVIVKESISPVNTVDLYEYSTTGVPIVEPASLPSRSVQGVFVAKMLDHEGLFAGNLIFYVENGKASMLLAPVQPVRNSQVIFASASYADHAKRISKILNAETIISPEDVRFVILDSIGYFFYIHNNQYNIFVDVGMIYNSPTEIEDSVAMDLVLDIHELKDMADKQTEAINELLKEKKAWEDEHPGEEWTFTGNNYNQNLVSVCSEIDNIANISDYLNIDFSQDQKTHSFDSIIEPTMISNNYESNQDSNRSPLKWIIVISVSIVIGGAVLWWFFYQNHIKASKAK